MGSSWNFAGIVLQNCYRMNSRGAYKFELVAASVQLNLAILACSGMASASIESRNSGMFWDGNRLQDLASIHKAECNTSKQRGISKADPR